MPATTSPRAVARDGALARLGADHDVGHVPQVDRRAVPGGQDDALEVGDVVQQAHAAQVHLFPAAHDDAAGGIGVAALDGLDHVGRGEPVGQQPVRVHQHLVLLDLAAEAVDLVHAGNRLEQRRHQPVLDAAQLHRVQALALERVLEDLAQAGADGAQLGVGAGRQLFAGGGQALEDHLPRPVGVGAVLEGDDHLRQAGLRQRAHAGHARQAAHRQFDGVAHPLLDVDRGQAGRLREDHHLRAGHVGEGVDGQSHPRGHADGQHHRGGRQHQHAVAQEPGQASHVGSLQSAQPAPILERSTSDLRRKAPSATTVSSPCSPPVISTRSPQARPAVTGRRT
jgi:hypothetical protein